MSKEIRLNNTLISFHVDKLLEEIDRTELIFIRAISGNVDFALEVNSALLLWIIKHHTKGSEVPSALCGCTFIGINRFIGLQQMFNKLVVHQSV